MGKAIIDLTSLQNVYPKNFENWNFDKKAPRNSDLERVTIAQEQGASEDQNFEAKPTQSKTNCRSSLGIYQVVSSIKEADVMIDFSSPEGTQKALSAALQAGLPLVIGTTGLTEEIQQKIETASAFIPILFSPNFSFGIAIFLKILPEIVKNIKSACSCKIVETHHIHKKDAPSGTALKLAKTIDSENEVTIESIREGETIGVHRIFFNLEGETLELRHEALSRNAFAQGALMAANFLVNKPAGVYTLMDLLS
ncbi:MAG TPA: dihydrodipicolinate reductase C-terminal domain-containing protein [Rhabdochlamydiaceae bacterium]|nr:dihydrodipicolinate reductase C-terminal domain-containing protein [Rhabdochlamydiaceae bacterium]